MQRFGLRTAKLIIVVGLTVAAHVLVCGDESVGGEFWATGTSLRHRLNRQVDILWTNTPLRRAIEGLAHAHQVAILIDRRVDPDQKLSLSLKGVSLESAFQEIARQCGLGVSRLGDVLYLGPLPVAEHLGTVATALEKDIRQLPPTMQRKFFRPKKLTWEDFTTPRELLAGLVRENRLKIANPDQVPHDLWAAADLPPCSLIERLTLIAIQFNLTFKVTNHGKAMQLVSLPENIRSVPTRTPTGPSPSRPASKRPTAKSPTSLDQVRIDRISIREKPLGPVLEQLAERLGLELQIDEKAIRAAGISLDQRVSVNLENASVDELLRELLKPTRLTFQRRRSVVEIAPSK